MKFCLSWLRELSGIEIDESRFCEMLSMAGLEVEVEAKAAPDFSGVITAVVRSVEQHPAADRLSICDVEVSPSEQVRIVCGAPNVRPGLRTALAKVGARLPFDMRVSEAEIRGQHSQGMLCGADELGLDEEPFVVASVKPSERQQAGKGLIELDDSVELGVDLRAALGLDDPCFELDVTPNRGDCLGMRGLARETAAILGKKSSFRTVRPALVRCDEARDVQVLAPAVCPRYLGRVVQGIDPRAKTPLWMCERLRRCGVRAISVAVDVTAYVMLEFGQPLHAFDLSAISGGIEVRFARDGERLKLLNGETLCFSNDDLLIADAEQALAFAGVMGGLDSAVNEQSSDIFLESAFFAAEQISGSARAYNLSTDASKRFERGVDFSLQEQALERATRLLIEIAGGKAGSISRFESRQDLPRRSEIQLTQRGIERLIGVTLPTTFVSQSLRHLGFAVKRARSAWLVTPPPFRHDIHGEADLIEELARLYGYAEIPSFAPEAKSRTKLKLAEEPIDAARAALCARGYQEVICYSFVNADKEQFISGSSKQIGVKNPIASHMNAMRGSLWLGLLEVLQLNLRRKRESLRIFEQGQCFFYAEGEKPNKSIVQREKLAGAICGQRFPESWAQKALPVDFFDIKGDVEAVLGLAQTANSKLENYQFSSGQHVALHNGQCAEILCKGESIGVVGTLRPDLRTQFGFDKDVFLFEIDVAKMHRRERVSYQALSKYPPVKRDLSLVIGTEHSAGMILAALFEELGSDLLSLQVIDVYEGEVGQEKQALTLRLGLQSHSRTMTEKEIKYIIDKALQLLSNKFSIYLRGD